MNQERLHCGRARQGAPRIRERRSRDVPGSKRRPERIAPVYSRYRPRSRARPARWCRQRWSWFAQITKPSNDGLSTTRDPRSSDAAKFLKRTLASDRPDPDRSASFSGAAGIRGLEEQVVTRAKAEGAANFVRDGDLTFAGDASLLSHSITSTLLTLSQSSLPFQRTDG